MAATRIIVVAALCLCAGCRTAGKQHSIDSSRELVGATEANTGQSPPPFESQQAAFGAPGMQVQPAAHIQPAQPVIVPEPLEIPSPATTELTLEQLEEMAISLNPALARAQALVDAAHGKWVQVGLPPNTELGYSGQQLGSHGQAEQQGVYIQQEFVRGHKLRLNRAIVDQEIEQAEQRLATQQQRVLTDVRLGFYDVLIAQRRLETTQQLVDIAKQGTQTAEALFNAKEVSQADVMRARIESQSADLLHANARNLHTAAWSRLVAVLGNPDIAPVPLVGDLEIVADQIDPDDTLQRILSESPELAVLLTEVERARWVIDRAYAEPIPNVDVQAVMQSDNGTGSTNGNLQVSMPIPWLNRNQGGIRQAQSELVAAERAVGQLELSLKRRLAGVYQRYASARNQMLAYSKPEGILANSQATLDFVRKGYQAGEIGYLDLLTAQRTYFQNNLAYVESLGQLWAAVVEIEGLLLKDSLESGGVAAP
ncbi:MAG: TolC family protein [Planctomycetaceae bacterium]|nr:TolC family protein [Planctomycetales bacterium]MCB9925311.1 TolC family protein [Planctomycetaceae bacterium]